MTVDTTLAPAAQRRPAAGRWIEHWDPEDAEFWAATGRRTARRNMIASIACEHVGFSVWSVWSVLVLFLGPAYHVDAAGKFLLTAAPTALGAALRLPYSLAVTRFGGRNWTIVSALLLLIPAVSAALLVRPGISYTALMLLACTAGVGGGNFASSMTNINSFYPQRSKGWALGLNAGGGNIGVATVQLVGLLVLATAGAAHPAVLLGVYIPLIVLVAACAAVFMDNLAPARHTEPALRQAARHPKTWLIALLYIGTFGSFIGFGFALGQVLQIQFGHEFSTPLKAAQVTFLGPLLGSLARPVGGRMADRFGPARISVLTFALMAAGAALVLAASEAESLPLFLTGFVALFVFSGIGNGSVYKLIPMVFRDAPEDGVHTDADADADADVVRGADRGTGYGRGGEKLAGAVIGIAGAVGAFGGVLVDVAFRESFLATKTGDGAYVGFIAVYALCGLVAWTTFSRRK